jgi:hypothetical protein
VRYSLNSSPGPNAACCSTVLPMEVMTIASMCTDAIEKTIWTQGRPVGGSFTSGSHRSRRDSLLSPDSCHPAQQAVVTQRQCAKIRGCPWVISVSLPRCGCRQSHPCTSGGFVFVEESAKAILSADVQMRDHGGAGDRFGQRM